MAPFFLFFCFFLEFFNFSQISFFLSLSLSLFLAVLHFFVFQKKKIFFFSKIIRQVFFFFGVVEVEGAESHRFVLNFHVQKKKLID